MRRILLTGMAGVGKSSVIRALAARGHRAIDTDSDEWSGWATAADGARDWIWREDRIAGLLAIDGPGDFLFVSGCKSNQGRFYPQFDRIILLSAPAETIIARLAARTDNPYGKDPAELREILGYIETVEPLLRRGATLEIDTRVPLDAVVAAVLDHARG